MAFRLPVDFVAVSRREAQPDQAATPPPQSLDILATAILQSISSKEALSGVNPPMPRAASPPVRPRLTLSELVASCRFVSNASSDMIA